MVPTSLLFQILIKTNRCLVRMKDRERIDVSSRIKCKSRYKKGDKTKIRSQQYIQLNTGVKEIK